MLPGREDLIREMGIKLQYLPKLNLCSLALLSTGKRAAFSLFISGVVTLGAFGPCVWLADASAAIYDIENLASADQTQPSARPYAYGRLLTVALLCVYRKFHC